MILVRDVFRVKFGRMRELKAIWNEGKPMFEKSLPKETTYRVMTDLVGPAYTFVLEMSFNNLADYENSLSQILSQPEWRTWYEKMVPLVDSSTREIFSIIS